MKSMVYSGRLSSDGVDLVVQISKHPVEPVERPSTDAHPSPPCRSSSSRLTRHSRLPRTPEMAGGALVGTTERVGVDRREEGQEGEQHVLGDHHVDAFGLLDGRCDGVKSDLRIFCGPQSHRAPASSAWVQIDGRGNFSFAPTWDAQPGTGLTCEPRLVRSYGGGERGLSDAYRQTTTNPAHGPGCCM